MEEYDILNEVDGKSFNIKGDIESLMQSYPSLFSEGVLQIDRIKEALGEEIYGVDHYELTWTGKSAARKEIQQQTTATLVPNRQDSIDFVNANNIFIEGENLEVLKILQRSYFNKIKLIYIDPPYNTGNDSFVYPDNFKEIDKAYKERAGLIDEFGNINKLTFWKKHTKENGQFHSTWLSMMYPRLFLAKNLLKEDGIIFISIDDNELDNLKLICDEIYGAMNFVGRFIWINRTTPNDSGIRFATDHEYILIYAKNISAASFTGNTKDLSNYKNPDNDPLGPWIADNPSAASGNDNMRFAIENPYTKEKYYPPKGRYWGFSSKRIPEWTESGKLVFPKESNKNFLLKKYLSDLKSDFKPLSSIIQGIFTSHGTKELKDLFKDASPFKYPKPSSLIRMLIQQITSEDDIILDFFAGSGTTAEATIEANLKDGGNRRFICVQLPEKYSSESDELNKKYKFVSEVTVDRIRRVIEKHSTGKLKIDANNLKLKCFKLSPTLFKFWQQNIDKKDGIIEQLDAFKDIVYRQDDEALVYELLLKTGHLLDAKIEKRTVGESEFYEVGKLVIILKGMSDKLVAHLVNTIKPSMVLCLDSAFGSNDQLKFNCGLEFKDNSIMFKSI